MVIKLSYGLAKSSTPNYQAPVDWMEGEDGFPREPVRDSATDHHCCDDCEHCGPGSFSPTLSASVARVRSFHVLCFPCGALTSHSLIQDSTFVPYATDGSRSLDHYRHHSMSHGPSRRRGPERDIFHSPLAYQGATQIQQRDHEWGPFGENPNYTPGSVQRDPAHGFVVPASSWDNGIRHSPAANDLRSSVGEFLPPPNAELSLWIRDTYGFTPDPNFASGETTFSRNDTSLILACSSPDYTPGVISTVEQSQPDQTRLSSGSQGRPLIAIERYVGRETEVTVVWQC